MKRFAKITVVVVLLMLLGMAAAMAEAPTVSKLQTATVPKGQPQTIFEISYKGEAYDWYIIRVDASTARETKLEPSRNGIVFGGYGVTGDTRVVWDYDAMGDDGQTYHRNSKGAIHRLVIKVDGKVKKTQDFFVRKDKSKEVDTIELSQWLSKNTVCSAGPQFRKLDGELTDKWYMFSVVDLSQDGVQTFDLIGGSVYVIGKVTVTVVGDNVWVNYEYKRPSRMYDGKEFFTIFPDLASVETVDPEQLESMTYGKAYSIEEDLGGDTSVLLFVCNRVTFQNSTPGIVRFYESNDHYEATLARMMNMLENEIGY